MWLMCLGQLSGHKKDKLGCALKGKGSPWPRGGPVGFHHTPAADAGVGLVGQLQLFQQKCCELCLLLTGGRLLTLCPASHWSIVTVPLQGESLELWSRCPMYPGSSHLAKPRAGQSRRQDFALLGLSFFPCECTFGCCPPVCRAEKGSAAFCPLSQLVCVGSKENMAVTSCAVCLASVPVGV